MLKPAAALRKDKTNAFASSMEHRHFATIAAIIAGMNDLANNGAVARRFASELAITNPKFDRERFLAACGYPE